MYQKIDTFFGKMNLRRSDKYMKKCEVLSPAGNMEMLKFAVLYGADAVYLGGMRFGARKFSNNFDDEELKEAVAFAHRYGVKVYLTMNTLIYEDEVKDFIEYAKYIHSIGVDAVLVQDFGMMKLLRECLPNLEIHASTQMHNNNGKMVELLNSIGVKRVVLDREMSLEEVSKLPKTVETEVFCHGALCISYSGECLFSSMVLNRSGNRGECAGMCRLPYKLKRGNNIEKEAKYYLSLKDLNTANYIPEIIEAGVSSLKIEGRMKSPEYVGYITKVIRELVDAYYEGHPRKLSSTELKNMKLLFNRDFTKGFINGASNEEMVNRESPNHKGIGIGTYNVRGAKIELVLDDDLEQGDVIRLEEANAGLTVNFLYDKRDKLIKSACKGSVVFIDNFLNIKGMGNVRKVSSYSLNKELQGLPKRTVNIIGKVKIKSDEPIELTVKCGEVCVKVDGVLPEDSRNRPITQDDVLKQIKKTGSTVYSFERLDVELDEGLFVNIKDLNELRRKALDELDRVRTSVEKDIIFNEIVEKDIVDEKRDFCLNVVVETEEQYEVAKKYASNIYSSNKKLCSIYNDVYPKYEEGATDIESKSIIKDLSSIVSVPHNNKIHADYMFNVTNSWTVRSVLEYVDVVCLSLELDMDKIRNLLTNVSGSRLEVLVYGRIELMKMKFNPVNNEGDALVDRNNFVYPVKESGKYNYLLSSSPRDMIDNILDLKSLGIKNFRVDLTDETKEKAENILSNIHKKIFK